MSQPVKRKDPVSVDLEEFVAKRQTPNESAKVGEILSSSPTRSSQPDSLLKRKLSPSSSKAFVEEKEQIEQIAMESKTKRLASATLSATSPSTATTTSPLTVFSTPPAKDPRRVSFSPSPGSEKGSPQPSVITVSEFAMEIAKERILESKLERKKKLQALAGDLPMRIEALERDLLPLGKLASEYWALRKKFDEINSMLVDCELNSPQTEDEKAKNDEEIDVYDKQLRMINEQIEKNKTSLDELIARLLEKFKDFELSNNDFSCFYRAIKTHEKHLPQLIEMLYEQLLNKCVNGKSFLVRVKKDIKKYQEKILSEFYKKSLNIKSLHEISFNPVLSRSETHNRGEVATKIEFFQKEQFLFSVYYKPRDALLDAAVINLFKEVNRLPGNEGKTKLPEYNILSVVTDSEIFSIWDYIEGQEFHGRADVIIAQFKSEQKLNERQEKILIDKLRRLESFCQPMALSDLHSANVLFKIDTEDPEITPIDLESIQEGAATGLYQNQALITPLTRQEAECVAKFRNALYSTPFRMISMATGELDGSLIEPTSFESLAEKFIKNLESQGYKFFISKKEIYHLILDDFLNNDIPYLVCYENGIFYGPVRHNKKIAIKNLEQEKK